MARTEAHQRLLEYMRGTRAEADLRLTLDQVSYLIDQLVEYGDLEMAMMKLDNFHFHVTYTLTPQGRSDDPPPSLPVEPAPRPLQPNEGSLT